MADNSNQTNTMTSSRRRTARIAGLYYLVLAITGAYGIMYVPSQVIVDGNVVATANNIMNQEFLFRTGIFSNLLCQVMFIFLVLTLYQLLKDVQERLAKIMVALVIVAVPIAVLIIFNQLFALITLNDRFMKTFEEIHRNTLTMAFLKMYGNGTSGIGIFWGLWLIPFGQLVIKSGFIPKIFGVFLILGGIAYIIDATAFIMFPRFVPQTNILVGIFSSLAEISMVLWLLIKGVENT